MARTPEEDATIERFANMYSRGQADFMLEIERSVCGCDYGGTSWTTRQEAEHIIELLELAPGRRLLEVGAGSGWPGLYLAKKSGCDVALVDLPFEGLRIARDRAIADRLAGAHWIALADGTALPFGAAAFDALFHSDVLCCLVEKLALLESCRRVIGPGGKMVFTTIYVAPGVSAAGLERAKSGGPPFVEASGYYPDMVRQAGWRLVESTDLIPARTNQNRCAQSRIPMDIIFDGRSMRLFQASQHRVTISS